MESRTCAFAEIKFAGEATGEFEGYASVFGGNDSYGHQVAPGAFKRTLAELKQGGRSLPMYFQHGMRLGADPRPVGVWKNVEEDDRGLRVSGKLAGLDTETGKYNLALMREGAMRGLSIGFRTVKADYPKLANGPRKILKDVDLVEISVVDDPADANARVLSIKANITIREIEEMLRNGTLPQLSAAEAKAFLAGGFKALKSARDAGEEDELGASLDRLIATINGK
jgi:HK97 family phage prohead protease